MRQSPKSARFREVPLLESSGVRETEDLSRSVLHPPDPLWKMDVKASGLVLLPRG
ncbi:hypothetical protein [Paenibacillus dakarensis]|uniref:hypothetical protein n=1 Tax=Paenibacillus dakarensis TaxID=1527293 RepID=UPI000ABA42D1|nr:hypothetical protein [Paenibacillus dakarensis]